MNTNDNLNIHHAENLLYDQAIGFLNTLSSSKPVLISWSDQTEKEEVVISVSKTGNSGK